MSDSRHIDWPSVHQRVQAAGELLNEAFNPSEEAVLRILAKRAQKAAMPADDPGAKSHERTLLLVRTGGYVGGISMGWVREVVPLAHGYARVPEADARLLGVINVHNQLVNLISPWPLINETPPAEHPASFPYAVLLRHPQLKLAVGCDRAFRLASVPEDAWQSERLFIHETGKAPGVLMDIPGLVKAWEHHEEPAAA